MEVEAANVRIGNDLTTESGYVIRASKKSSILIGNDCMFSYNLNMRTKDGHVIFDVKTEKNINYAKAGILELGIMCGLE